MEANQLAYRALKKLDERETELAEQLEAQRQEICQASGDIDDEDPMPRLASWSRSLTPNKPNYFEMILARADEIKQLILARQSGQYRRPRRQDNDGSRQMTLASLIELIEGKAKRMLTHLANLSYEIEEEDLVIKRKMKKVSRIITGHQLELDDIRCRRLRILNGDISQAREELDLPDEEYSESTNSDDDILKLIQSECYDMGLESSDSGAC